MITFCYFKKTVEHLQRCSYLHCSSIIVRMIRKVLLNMFCTLRLLTHSGYFSGSDTFRSVLIYGKEQECRKKYFITVQNNSSSWEGLTVETRMGWAVLFKMSRRCEKIITLKPALSEQDVYKDKANFFSNKLYFDKYQTRFITWFNCLFTGVYMIYLMFPSASQLALISWLQVRAKLSAFEYESKERK